jgi:hypothetical protein
MSTPHVPHAPTPADSHTTATDGMDPATDRRLLLTGLASVAGVAALASMAKAGPLTPPGGPITSTPGPEPRIAVNAQNTPGSPTALFVITQPGSYYLTGNVQGVAGRNGILITSSNVTLDLNGFTVQGVAGSLDGIAGLSSANVTVCNGIVRGWDGSGVAFSGTATNSVVRNITAASNGARGIQVNTAGQVVNCLASGNVAAGISGELNCQILECISLGNRFGIEVNTSCLVARCSVANCVQDGIRAVIACSIMGNLVRSAQVGLRLLSLVPVGINRVERNEIVTCSTSVVAESGFNYFVGNISSLAPISHWNIAPNNYIRAVICNATPAFNGGSGGVSISSGDNDPYLNFTLA